MKKRLIALALSILLLLSGCGENTYSKEKIEVKLSPYEIPAAAPQWATLYYPSPDNTSLLALSQQISGESSLYDNMMSALLNGTEEGYISPFPSGVLSRSIMLVEDILYLDMSWQMLEMELPQFLACVATLVYTYTALPEVSFVNITVEGKQLTLPTDKSTPIMLLSHYNGSLSALTNEYGNDAAPIKRAYCAMYISDNSGKYIIPQAMSVDIDRDKLDTSLLSALLANSTAIFADGFMLTEPPRYNKVNDELAVTLVCPSQWKAPADWLGPAAITSVLNSLYPNVKRLILTVNDPLGQSVFTLNTDSSDYYGIIRSKVDVIMPKSSGKGLMHGTHLALTMPYGSGIKAFINEYICNIAPSLRNMDSIVNDVYIQSDTVIIDLGEKYFTYYESASLDADSEYAVIYSLITTACTYTGTTKALILQDSQLRTTLGGYIKLDAPLMTLPAEFLSSIEK